MKVLIIEDERDLRRTIVQSFSENGYAVEEAEDGEEGLYRIKNFPYSAIVMDLMLPKRDGWEILEEVRRLVTTPILLLTARDTVKDRVRGLNSGADDYLVKPFDLEELLARVQALIRRASGTLHPVILLANDVVLDTGTRTLSIRGKTIELTAREYTLVEMLALRRGKIVSRTALYDHLFAEDDDSISNLLDVHVYNLRKKLGKGIINTHRGHGYSIE